MRRKSKFSKKYIPKKSQISLSNQQALKKFLLIDLIKLKTLKK